MPALALGVSVGGEVETHAIGCEPDTLFRVASITKPFTATLALELLDLEAATGVWPADVRVRHLLSHTSGYDCERGDLAALRRRRRRARRRRGGAAGGAALRRRRAGLVVREHRLLAGRALCGRARRVDLRGGARGAGRCGPAGLEATSFGEPELAGTGPDALPGPYPRARRPSGGLVSNVPDLLRFGRWHLARPEAARLRVVHGKPIGGVYGLGLFGERVGGVEVWGHGGSYGGFQSSLLLVPDRDAVFVGLTNSSRGDQALREIEDAFFERVLGARRRVPATVELPADVLDGFAGTYANSDDRRGQFAGGRRPGRVTFEDGEFAARPIGERTFEITEGDRVRERFDFPLEGFGRFGSRLAERVTS